MIGEPSQARGWSSLLSTTYGLYRQRFGTFFRIALPAVLVAFAYRYFERSVLNPMLRSAWNSKYFWVVVISPVVTKSVYWLISSFFFAAVATHVLRSDENPRALSDAYSIARARIGPIIAIGVTTWLLFEAGAILGNGALYILLDDLRIRLAGTAGTIIFSVPLLLVAGLLSRWGLAIPALMTNPHIRAFDAMKESIRKSENWEFFFMLFLVKSALIGFGVYWVVDFLLMTLSARDGVSGAIYPWLQSAVYICAAAALESPLFIAFSVLYKDAQSTERDAVPAAIG
jgi:hypothetical protein